MRKIFAFILILLLITPSLAFAQSNYRLQIGGDIVVESHEVIMGDVVAVLGNITVYGKVSGRVVAILGDIRVNGEVMGNVTSVGGNILRGETSIIRGNSTEIGASGIKGLINRIKRQSVPLNPGMFIGNIRSSFFKFMRFLGLLAGGILIILLFPNAFQRAADLVEKGIGRKFLIGIAIILLIPFAVIFMFVTLIGIPLIPIFLMLVYGAGFFGYLCISIFIGSKLRERMIENTEPILEFVLGALILWLIQLVPFIGRLVSITVLITSLGIATETQFGTKVD